jgi:hypothetical protein
MHNDDLVRKGAGNNVSECGMDKLSCNLGICLSCLPLDTHLCSENVLFTSCILCPRTSGAATIVISSDKTLNKFAVN